MNTKTNYGKSKSKSNLKQKTWKPNIRTWSMQDKSVILKHIYIWNNEHEWGWTHTQVAHFLSYGAHFCRMPVLWTPIMNNKTYPIENLKLIIH
jgi:hypothetical protein